MDKIKEILIERLNEDCKQFVISNPRKKEEVKKITVRPVLLKDELCFQISSYTEKQVFHENVPKEQIVEEYLGQWAQRYKQMQLIHKEETVTALINKKGHATISRKNLKTAVPRTLQHNRKKRYLIEEGTVVPFLVDLGVMTKEGKIVQKKYDKFRQINRFLEFVEDVEPALAKDREITILDFGCGKSYLTFAMYYYLHERCGRDVRMIGLDLKEDVIAHCNTLAQKYGYEKLSFLTGNIKDYEDVNAVDMVVTLHACDTATDYALYKAVEWNASVILSVPCCQHELNQLISCETLSPMLSYGILKERFSALATDAMRAELLSSKGYETQILEFIDLEHTPKNLLIRAVKKEMKKNKKEDAAFVAFRSFLSEPLTLERLFANDGKENA